MLTARIWRERGCRYRNEVARCKKCGKMHFPPRRVCDSCGLREFDIVTMAETGKVISYTVIRVSPPGFADVTPYAVAVLEMDDGTRTMAQLADVDPNEVRTGMKVQLEFRRVRQGGPAGVISYGHKAVPA